MAQVVKDENWGHVKIRNYLLDRIREVRKTHPEYDSDRSFVEECVVLRLEKIEGGHTS